MAGNRGGARPGAGRKKGSRNARTKLLDEKLEQIACPFEALERVGVKAEKAGDYKTAQACFSDLCSYVRARPRAPEEDNRKAGPFEGWSLEELGALRAKLTRGEVSTQTH